jgi:hypothetical protein
MLEKSIRVSTDFYCGRNDTNELCMSNSMSLDEMLTLYADIKIVEGYKENIKIDDKRNKYES